MRRMAIRQGRGAGAARVAPGQGQSGCQGPGTGRLRRRRPATCSPSSGAARGRKPVSSGPAPGARVVSRPRRRRAVSRHATGPGPGCQGRAPDGPAISTCWTSGRSRPARLKSTILQELATGAGCQGRGGRGAVFEDGAGRNRAGARATLGQGQGRRRGRRGRPQPSRGWPRPPRGPSPRQCEDGRRRGGYGARVGQTNKPERRGATLATARAGPSVNVNGAAVRRQPPSQRTPFGPCGG